MRWKRGDSSPTPRRRSPRSMTGLIHWLDLLGVAVFAASGALVASRKEMDIVGFALVGTLTGIGGGTLRDLLLDRPVFWIGQSEYLLVCLGVSASLFVLAPFIARRYPVLLWADAAGVALFAVTGSAVAWNAGAAWPVSVVMGMMSCRVVRVRTGYLAVKATICSLEERGMI